MVASPEEFKRICGRNIKKVREAQGLTQEVLASNMNTTREQVSRHERGEHVTIDVLFDYAKALCISVDEIMKSEEDPFSEVMSEIRALPENIQGHILTALQGQLAICAEYTQNR